MKKFIPGIILVILSLIFFKAFFTQGKLPVPSDTIVGLYYPFRDYYAKDYPRGIPFKNFMVTDPIRQQYPWKSIAINTQKKGDLPIWNPYTLSGGPLLSNFQSGVFYPLNLLFFVLPFPLAWGTYIFFEPLLILIFMYLFLSNLKLDKKASIFGSISLAFGGFSISWLEWGNVIHTALWLPLILFLIDKYMQEFQVKNKKFNTKQLRWLFCIVIALLSSFLAGHLQLFFYTLIFSFAYLVFKIWEKQEKVKIATGFFVSFIVFLVLSAIVWIPGFKFILLSGRGLDQDWHTITGWFVPWQNLIQFVIPDFFGNPATLNYFGVWNYGEFIGYIGIGAVIFSLSAILRKEKQVLFFICAFLLALLFALPTIIAKIPFKLDLPFISSSQPTRLIFLADFSLSVLSAMGFDYFIRSDKKKNLIWILGVVIIFFAFLWIFAFLFKGETALNVQVIKQNLILPSILLFVNLILIIFVYIFKKHKNLKFTNALMILIVVVLFLDLLRFGWKYTPFTDSKYLYPQTKTLDFISKNVGNYRIMSTDSGIMPPNFSIMYKIQTLDGYDPLYLQRYGELMAALERGSPDIHTPFGFNRIITPQNYHSALINVLGVKYVLSLNEITDPHFKKVFTEGGTLTYLNKNVLPRAFFTGTTYETKSKQETINFMFDHLNDLKTNAAVENVKLPNSNWNYLGSSVKINNYSENKIILETENQGEGFLVLTDTFYPTWHAKIDGKETKIYLTDYNFRGIIVPKGHHNIEYYITLF